LSRARAVVESIALTAVLVLPWYVAVFTERVFEAEKMAALRALALPAAAACIAYGAASDRRARLAARWRTTPAAARCLAAAAALFWLAEGLATLTSRAPHVSVLGSYDRGFGWLSTTALAVLAAGAAGIAARPGGGRRLASFIGASILPPALYGIGQRFGADPLPWFGDVVTRVSGSAGASVMLGAHIALALPFALWATASAYGAATVAEARPTDRSADGSADGSTDGSTDGAPNHITDQLRLAAWLLIDAAALIALVLSGSRGPALAVAGALGITVLVVAARAGQRRLAIGAATLGIVALAAIGALNRRPAAFGPIVQLPLVGRLAFALDPDKSTTRVRLRLWEGSVAAIGDLEARTLVGTGPETMPLTWATHYPSILAYDEPRGWVPDRAHNLWLDRLLTTGALGAASLLALIVAALVAALDGLGLVAGRRGAAAAVATWLGAAAGAAAAARIADGGWRLAAPAFGLGLVGGLAAWLAFIAIRRPPLNDLSHPSPTAGGGVDARRRDAGGGLLGLPIAAVATLTAFVVETQVGFVVTPTAIVLWLTVGALIGAAMGGGPEERAADAPTIGDGAFAAALVAVTGLFDFGRSGLVGSGALGALVLVGLASGVVGAAVGGGRSGDGRWARATRGGATGRSRDWVRIGVVIAAAAVAHRLALRLGTDGPSDALPAAAATVGVWALAVGGLVGLHTGARGDGRRGSAPATAVVAVAIAVAGAIAITMATGIALSTTVADAAYKEGRSAWEAAVPAWRERGDGGRAEALLDGAVERYGLAGALAPWEARYRLAIGMAEDVRGDLLTELLTGELERSGRADATDEYADVDVDADVDGVGPSVADLAERRDAAFDRAMAAFATAQRLAPGDPVALLAKARGLRLWGDVTREPTRRAARLALARAAYAAVRSSAPNWPEVRSEAAAVELLDGDVKTARALAEQALALDGFYYQGWKTIAQARLADADPAGAAAAWAHYFDDPRNAGDVAALRAYAAAQLQAGDATGALDTAQAVVRLAPDDARAWADLAVLRDRAGDRRGAIEAAERAAGLSPADAGIRQWLDGLSAPERP